MPALRKVGSALAQPSAEWRQRKTRETDSQPVSGGRLLADTQLLNYSLVPLGIVLLQIIEQATTSADHHKKTAARSVVLLVCTEVLGQLADALTEKGNLNFRAAGVRGVGLILLDDIGFLLSC